MEQCQRSVSATSNGDLPPSSARSETHAKTDHREQAQGQSDEETLARPQSPDQIQQSAELEPFISPTKQPADLLSMTSTSPSAPQTPVPARARPLLKVWSLEAASLLLSYSCFVLIVVVLAHFDQQGLPDWPLSITLNSFLAFFTTITKATFMLPVSTAISQTKWTWFLQERPIYDFHILDQASRGLRGSFILLWRAHIRNFISLGALIAITSTITSPVTQLAINYPIRDQAVSGGAYAKAIRKIETPSDYMGQATAKAVRLALASDNSLFNNPIAPLGAFCSTGNCTFDRYHTLGVCVKLANISSHLKVESFGDAESAGTPIFTPNVFKDSMRPPGSKIWKASLSDDFYLLHYDSAPLYTDILNGNDTFGFRHDMDLLRTRIASFALIFTTPIFPYEASTESDLIAEKGGLKQADSFWHEAWEVLMHLCVQSYDTKVQAGAEETRMVSSMAIPMEPGSGAFVDHDCTQPLYFSEYPCQDKVERWNETLVLQDPAQGPPRSGSKSGAFSANYRAMTRMGESLRGLTTGWAINYFKDSDFENAISSATASDFLDDLWGSVLFLPESLLNHTTRYIRLNNIYLNLATSLSSVIRQGDPYITHAFNVTGKAWTTEAYVEIRWGWLSFLAFELVLAASVLVMTIFTQRSYQKSDKESYANVCDLKESSLAALVALDNDCRSVVGDGLGPVGELEKTAKEVHVRLRGNRLVAVGETRGDSA